MTSNTQLPPADAGRIDRGVVPLVPKGTWLARAELLHEQTGMPWDQAHELALTEHGIGTAAIDELIGECAPQGIESLLATPDDLRAFCRAVLVFGEALREDTAEALTLDLADAALAAWDCIAELPATQARRGGAGHRRGHHHPAGRYRAREKPQAAQRKANGHCPHRSTE